MLDEFVTDVTGAHAIFDRKEDSLIGVKVLRCRFIGGVKREYHRQRNDHHKGNAYSRPMFPGQRMEKIRSLLHPIVDISELHIFTIQPFTQLILKLPNFG